MVGRALTRSTNAQPCRQALIKTSGGKSGLALALSCSLQNSPSCHNAISANSLTAVVKSHPRHCGRQAVPVVSLGIDSKAGLMVVVEQARAGGYDRISLYTNEAMVENQALYERIGYVETRRADEHGYARVFYEKEVAG